MRLAVGLAALALTAGCGSSAHQELSAAAPLPSASHEVSPPDAGTSPAPIRSVVTVTDDDSGTTVRLRRGQHLRVRLSTGPWDPPVSSVDGVVVRRSSTGGYPSDSPVDATFDAVGVGSADITAQSDAACFHVEPRCMMASRQWQVRVTVL